MDLKFFNLIVSMEPFKDEEFQAKYRDELIECGIHPMEVRSADFIEKATGKKVYEALVITCVETVPGIMEIFKTMTDRNEIEYEGLPTLI